MQVSLIKEGHGSVGLSPDEATRLTRGLKHLPYESTAENTGAVQPGEAKVAWRPHSNLPASEEGLQGSQKWSLHQELQ